MKKTLIISVVCNVLIIILALIAQFIEYVPEGVFYNHIIDNYVLYIIVFSFGSLSGIVGILRKSR